MNNEIRNIILKKYKNIENNHIGIVEYQPLENYIEYRIMFKIKELEINFVVNQDVIDIFSKDKNNFENYIEKVIDTNILYYYKGE